MAQAVSLTNQAIEDLQALIEGHVDTITGNPHSVTSAQIVGLDKVENHSDLNRSTSKAEQLALIEKINIADIANAQSNPEDYVLSKVPLPASFGKQMASDITSLDPANWDEQIQALEDRIDAVSNWT